MNQLHTQTGGIIAVELGPNGKIYYTSPDGIYTYDVQPPDSTSASPNPLPLIILGVIATITVTMALVYAIIRYRSKHSSLAPKASNSPIEE